MKIYVVPKMEHVYLKSLYSNIQKNGDFEIFGFEKKIDTLIYFLKSDIIHLHWIEGIFIGYHHKNTLFFTFIFTTIYLIFLFTMKFVLRKKLVITLHNIIPHVRLYPRLENKIFKISLKLADSIIVHNNYSKKSAQQLYDVNPNKLFTVPIGNFNSSYPNKISKKKSRNMLNIPQDAFVVLFFGTINKYKGIEELLEVFNDLLSNFENMYLVIAGSCLDNDLIKKTKKFSVKFNDKVLIKTEYVDDNEIQLYMNASDVGILPYRKITTSGSVLLFMAFKKPVIVTYLEPVVDLIGKNGIYYKRGNLTNLKKEVIKASSGFYDLDSLGEKYFQISKKYNWKSIAKKTIEIYNSLVNL